MTWLNILIPLAVSLLGTGGLRAILTARHDKKLGVSKDAREDRDQVATASAELIDRLMARIDALEDRTGELETARRGDLEYIEELRAHIYAGSPPPPPARPPALTPAS